MDMFKKLKEKKGEMKMSPEYKESKQSMLKSLISDMSGMMAEPLKGLKKVTVASDSPQGLEKGLDKAKELLDAKKMGEEESDPSAEEAMEEDGEAEDEMSEEAQMSPEEIDAKIKELMDLKKHLESK